jgi:predicted transposase YdaD
LALLQLLTTNQNKAEVISRQVLDSAENPEAFRRYLSLIESILANKFPQMTTEEITRMLGLKSADITQSRFYQEIRQAGLQAGLQEGREREARLIIRQLERRLGPLSSEIQTQILSLPVTELERLGEALLDFTALVDLTEYLTES